MKKTALLTAIGSFAAEAAIRALRARDYRIVGCDIYPEVWLLSAASVDAFYQVPRASEQEAYLDRLEALCREEAIDLLLPLTDVELDALAGASERFEALGVTLAMPEPGQLGLLRDKYALSQRLAECDFMSGDAQLRCIPTELASELDFEQLSYPIVLKPRDGRSSEGLYRLQHEDQLGFALACIEEADKLHDTALERYIAQPQLRGRVVTVDLVRDRAGHCQLAAREELIRTQNGAGISVRSFYDEALYEGVRKIADELSLTGCVNFEFICGEGSGLYYFLECNPRLSGGVGFSVLAGVDIVDAGLCVYEGLEIAPGCALKEQYMSKRYVEGVTA